MHEMEADHTTRMLDARGGGVILGSAFAMHRNVTDYGLECVYLVLLSIG